MSTPVATIADALIAFIMSLLRDPVAVQEFAAAPQAVMAKSGVGDACLADVKAVKPVIVDHPSVVPSPPPAAVIPVTPVHPNPPSPPEPPSDVIREITRIVNQFTTIDNRSTLVDQSVNQNIWTNGGDVTQVFDQDSVVASGDHAVAAGHDASVVNSDTDIRVGDVSIGNTSNDGSFNANGDGSDVTAPATPVAPVDAGSEGDLGAAVGDAVDTSLVAVSDATDSATHATGVADDAADTSGDSAADAGDAGQDAAPDAAADAPAPADAAPTSAALPVDDPLGDGLNEPQAYTGEDHAAVAVDDAYVEDQPVDDQ